MTAGGVLTILFTDIVGSTALHAELGDEAAHELVSAHLATIGNLVEANEGTVIKEIGDGVLAVFRSARRALACASAIQQAQHEVADPLLVRVGIAAGEVIEKDGDVHGLAVATAARIAALAAGGEVLVADLVRQLAGPDPQLRFADRGPTALRGVPEPVPIASLEWGGTSQRANVESTLRIRLLGGLDVEGFEQRTLGSRKARSLVRLLACARGGPVPTDRIVDCLWGDSAPARPAEQVAVLVSRLRNVLGAERLTRSDAGYRLVADWLDVAELDERAAEASARLAAGNASAARMAATAALELVRGPALVDEEAPWADEERITVERAIANCRLLAAEAALASGAYAVAATEADAALDHDPYDEVALRVLMRAHAAAGRPASALAAYARVRVRLAEELGVDPTGETEALHTELLLRQDDNVAPNRVDSPGPVSSARLVGRNTELARLHALLDVARGGAVAAAVVEGEAGIGKSAFLSVWCNSAESAGAVVLRGRCDEFGADLPLQPVLDALEHHFALAGASAASDLVGPDAAVLGPLLAGTAPTDRAPSGTAASDPLAGQAQLYAALLSVVHRLAPAGPVVLAVDDLHLAAPGTVEFLRVASRRGRGLLVLAARRSGGSYTLPEAEVITLGPLSLAAAIELVGEDRASDLHERSNGHPLFLVELAASDDDEALPSSIRESVAKRVDALAEAASTLRSAAVLGAEIDLDLLADVLRRPAGELIDHLEEAVDARLLEERESGLRFCHELVRDALVSGTTATRRKLVHADAARALAGRARRDHLQIAFHARLGGDDALAALSLVAAADEAAGRYDISTAARLLDEAVELNDSAVARESRARIRMTQRDLDGATVDAAAAIDLGGGVEAFEVAGWVAYYRREFDAARRYADEGVRRSPEGSLRNSCLALAGRIRHTTGDLAGAAERLEEASHEADPELRAVTQLWLGSLRVHQGRPADALEVLESGLLEPARLRYPFAVPHGFYSRIFALGLEGRVADALVALDAWDATLAEMGDPGLRFAQVARNVRAWLYRNIGRGSEADELNALAVEHCVGQLFEEPRNHALLDQADGRLLVDDLDGAARFLGEFSYESPSGSMVWHQMERHALLSARLALAAGDGARAAELAAALIGDAASHGMPRYEAFGQLVLASALATTGESVDDTAVGAAVEVLDRVARLEGWRFLADLARASGDDRWWKAAEARGAVLANAAGQSAAAWVQARLTR